MYCATIVEPRRFPFTEKVIKNFRKVLDNKWDIKFFHGKDDNEYWKEKFNFPIQYRELDVNNMVPQTQYNDLLKSEKFWNDHKDYKYVLIFQSDTWLNDIDPQYNIDYYIEKGYDYIGGGLHQPWKEMILLNIQDIPYRNYNGGLSLRKTSTMLEIISKFPPKQTEDSIDIAKVPEDVYCVLGCKYLDKKLGEDEECDHFCLHFKPVNRPFGLHKPFGGDIEQLLRFIPHQLQ